MKRGLTAREAGLMSCHVCGQLAHIPADHAALLRCPRCRAPMHPRKPASVSTTWALIIAAAVLFVPANLLPMMTTSSLLGRQQDTIMSGVVFLWQSGSWPLAAVVFFASIMVRTRLYRVVEFVGRWSMLDIYVITILVALVNFRGLATIEAGPAAIAFGAVVVLTMFAAMSFDPRLIWDPLTESGKPATHV
jgi:paraquat-inducible protein A